MPSNPSCAYCLIAHGSRDPRPQVALEQLATLVGQVLARQTAAVPYVRTGTLEFAAPLDQQLCKLASEAQAQGYSRLRLVPLFLLPGVHVSHDIPQAVAQAQTQLSNFPLEQSLYLGSQPAMVTLLMDKLRQASIEHWILLAHGTRLPAGNQAIANLAKQLNVTPAYWFVPPRLPEVLANLVEQNYQQIGILPYFLFAGTTTDAIAEQVQVLQHQYPQVNLTLTSPLEPTEALAEVIVHWMTQSSVTAADLASQAFL